MQAKKINAVVTRLTGNPHQFTLEHRLFNLMLFLIILIAVWGSAYNYSLHLPMYTVYPCLIALAVAIFTFYLGRVRKAYSEPMIYPIVVLSTIILGFIFFLNSGSAGPMVIFILAMYHIFVILTNGRHQYTILIMLLVSVFTLYTVELMHPEFVSPYSGPVARFWDTLITFSVSTVILISSTIMFKRNYNNERRMLAQRNMELNESNAIIREQKVMLEQKTEHLEAALSELQEKNQTIHSLMKELNHRVGNNLQMIYSLLNMQEMEIPDQKARQSIGQAKNRILAISLLHQKLYRSEQARDIDLPAYIRELCGYLVQDIMPPVDMKISFQPPDFRSDIKASIHIGLIVNEIITNALKHAWLPAHVDRKIVVHASVEDNNRLEMILTDNGKGFAQKKNAWADSRFGLRFVQSVLDQYSGEMNLTNQSGGVVEIGMTLP